MASPHDTSIANVPVVQVPQPNPDALELALDRVLGEHGTCGRALLYVHEYQRQALGLYKQLNAADIMRDALDYCEDGVCELVSVRTTYRSPIPQDIQMKLEYAVTDVLVTSPAWNDSGFAPTDEDVKRFLAERQSFLTALGISAPAPRTEKPSNALVDLPVIHDTPLALKTDLTTTPTRITVRSCNLKTLDMICAPVVTIEEVISAFLTARLIKGSRPVLVTRDVPYATPLIGLKPLGELGIISGEVLNLLILWEEGSF